MPICLTLENIEISLHELHTFLMRNITAAELKLQLKKR